MATSKTGGSGGAAILGAVILLLVWFYKTLKAMSVAKLILLLTGIGGFITLIVGLFVYFNRTTTEPRERTVRKKDGRYNVGYREELETYQAEIELPWVEIQKNKRHGLRIGIVGILMTLCIPFIWITPDDSDSVPQNIRYITTEAGMNLRDTPSATGRLLHVIPFRGEVEVLESGREEVIYGKTAKWFRVTHNGKTGWIWGYFTSSTKP